MFGSHAIGTSREDSDIDLLVVKDEVDRPLERRIQVERLLSDRSTPLDIQVYTPQEMRVLFSIGDPFIEEIVEKGKVVYMRSATPAWIREAHDDSILLQFCPVMKRDAASVFTVSKLSKRDSKPCCWKKAKGRLALTTFWNSSIASRQAVGRFNLMSRMLSS